MNVCLTQSVILNFVFTIVVTYFVCGLGGVVCMLTDIRTVQVYGLTVLVSSGLAMNVVQSQAVELFPTSLR